MANLGLVWAILEKKVKGKAWQGRAEGLRGSEWQCHRLVEVGGVVSVWLCPEGWGSCWAIASSEEESKLWPLHRHCLARRTLMSQGLTGFMGRGGRPLIQLCDSLASPHC